MRRLLTVGALAVAGALAIAGCRKEEEAVRATPRATPRTKVAIATQQSFMMPIEGGKTVGAGTITAILD